MEFEVLFVDGDRVWKPFDQDLAGAVQFEEFCVENPELYLLCFTVEKARAEAKRINRLPITEVEPGLDVYVDLRYFGTRIYDEELQLEDKYHLKYVVRFRYTRWAGKSHQKIDAIVPVFMTNYMVNNLFVCTWGKHRMLTENMIEVTPYFLSMHRDILQLIPEKQRKRLEAVLAPPGGGGG